MLLLVFYSVSVPLHLVSHLSRTSRCTAGASACTSSLRRRLDPRLPQRSVPGPRTRHEGSPPSCLVRGPGTLRCAGPGSERRLRSREHSLFRTPPPRFPPWRHGCLAVDWLREAGILQQCRASGAELLLLAWRVGNGHWRFFVVVLRLLDVDQKRALTTSHLWETPEDLPKEYCLGHAGQEVVDVQGLNAALRRGFTATASLESSEESDSE